MKNVLFAAVVMIAATAATAAQAQWNGCPAGQWCQQPPPQKSTAPVYQQPDPYEQQRKNQEAMAEAERQRQAQNRPMCTTYRKDPMTGDVKAVTAPCY